VASEDPPTSGEHLLEQSSRLGEVAPLVQDRRQTMAGLHRFPVVRVARPPGSQGDLVDVVERAFQVVLDARSGQGDEPAGLQREPVVEQRRPPHRLVAFGEPGRAFDRRHGQVCRRGVHAPLQQVANGAVGGPQCRGAAAGCRVVQQMVDVRKQQSPQGPGVGTRLDVGGRAVLQRRGDRVEEFGAALGGSPDPVDVLGCTADQRMQHRDRQVVVGEHLDDPGRPQEPETAFGQGLVRAEQGAERERLAGSAGRQQAQETQRAAPLFRAHRGQGQVQDGQQ